MTLLFTVDELAEYLPFEMTVEDQREALGALEDLSDDARRYGLDLWTAPAFAPQPVKNLIRRAAARHMKNYEGYTTSRAGDETVAWTDRGHESGSAYFTENEKKSLRAYNGGASGLQSVQVAAYRTVDTDDVGWVPSAEGADFPYYAGSDPW